MKKLLCIALTLTLLLAGCGPRGAEDPEASAAAHTIQPLELSEEEEALLNLVGGSDADYGLFDCAVGEGVTGCTIEVLSWQDGTWTTLAEGGLSSLQSGSLRLGIVLSGDKITVNFQDGGGGRYSYAPRLDGIDRATGSGRAWTWLESAQALTPGTRAPLYLEVYDSGDGVRAATLPDTFSDAGQLDSYARAYAVAVTLEG